MVISSPTPFQDRRQGRQLTPLTSLAVHLWSSENAYGIPRHDMTILNIHVQVWSCTGEWHFRCEQCSKWFLMSLHCLWISIGGLLLKWHMRYTIPSRWISSTVSLNCNSFSPRSGEWAVARVGFRVRVRVGVRVGVRVRARVGVRVRVRVLTGYSRRE